MTTVITYLTPNFAGTTLIPMLDAFSGVDDPVWQTETIAFRREGTRNRGLKRMPFPLPQRNLSIQIDVRVIPESPLLLNGWFHPFTWPTTYYYPFRNQGALPFLGYILLSPFTWQQEPGDGLVVKEYCTNLPLGHSKASSSNPRCQSEAGEIFIPTC